MNAISINNNGFINSLLSIIMIIIFIVLVNYNHLRIYNTINKYNTNNSFYDIRSWFYGNTTKYIDVDSLVNQQLKEKKKQLDASFSDFEYMLDVIDNCYNTIEEDIYNDTIDKVVNYTCQVNETNEKIIQLNDLIKNVEGVQQKNKDTFTDITNLYKNKIYNYLDSLLRSLHIIQYQYNIAAITSNMNGVMNHLDNLYNSIYTTLTKPSNISFIRKYINNEYTRESVPVFNQTNHQNYNNSFNDIDKVFMNYGMGMGR